MTAIGAGEMRFPCFAHVVTCLPCGYREPIRGGCGYPARCPNCGGTLEHFETEIGDRAEWRSVYQAGSTIRVARPRLVIGGPA